MASSHPNRSVSPIPRGASASCTRPAFHVTAIAAALSCFSAAGSAQVAAESATLPTVSVTVRKVAPAQVSGFEGVSGAEAPFQASVVTEEELKSRGVRRLSDLARIDAAVSDAYNAEGYWDSLTVRGFVIDNRFNYRRDGLPINAQTSIPLDNKEQLEVLKGTSGIQAGTSAPGGLVNVIVKRPTAAPLRSITLGLRDRGSVLAAVDISQRFGADEAFGLRLNAARERLRPQLSNADGGRHLLALAGDWRITPDTLIEVEAETSRRSQPSQAAFSLLGDRVPSAGDPRLNLNNQPWSQPVVFEGKTASLRVTQRVDPKWRVTAHALAQRLKTDDRLAFPFGCDAEGNYDRYCSDGTYDFYDFRSENERRRSDVLELAVHGDLRTGSVGHRVFFGVMQQRVRMRFQDQANNLIAQRGNVDGSQVVPESPALTDANTNRDERSTEFFVRDAVSITERLTGWAGLRHTRLHRESIRTSGELRATDYRDSVTTPWLAASYRLAEGQTTYASWGQGIESDVVPNRSGYSNRGTAIGPLKSTQFELGFKASERNVDWDVAYFRIKRPIWARVVNPGPTQADGDAVHQGLDTSATWRSGAWLLQGGLQALHAERSGSADASVNGKRPPNVPVWSARWLVSHNLAALPGVSLQASGLAESNRMVTLDNSARIPGYGRIDLGGAFEQRVNSTTLLWRAGVDNVLDRRAWRESPYQFDHYYLYPMSPRTFRISVEAKL